MVLRVGEDKTVNGNKRITQTIFLVSSDLDQSPLWIQTNPSRHCSSLK